MTKQRKIKITQQREQQIFKEKGKSYFCCLDCGSCYFIDKHNELIKEDEKKMTDREKMWLRQGELSLCCRERYDKWLIGSKMG